MGILPMIAVVVLILLGIFALIIQREKQHQPDYYSFFIMGVIWLVGGVYMGNYMLSALGMAFAFTGYLHKDTWKKGVKWEELSSEDKKVRIALMLVVSFLFIVGIAIWFLVENGIISVS